VGQIGFCFRSKLLPGTPERQLIAACVSYLTGKHKLPLVVLYLRSISSLAVCGICGRQRMLSDIQLQAPKTVVRKGISGVLISCVISLSCGPPASTISDAQSVGMASPPSTPCHVFPNQNAGRLRLAPVFVRATVTDD